LEVVIVKISLIALSFALLFIAPNIANGCSCSGDPTICVAYASADAVFIGSVRKVDQHEPKKNAAPSEIFSGQIAHVQVERVFKGKDESEVIFRSRNTSCDPFYKEGQRWLFYAYFDKKSQTWSIRPCDRSTLIENAADDLLYLQALPGSAQRTRISGAIERYENDPVKRFTHVENISRVYISGIKVKISAEHKTYEVYTDGNGVYEIYDLPPGRYTIQPEIPTGLKSSPIYRGEIDDSDEKSIKAVLREKSCVGVDFVFSADTAISGKVFGADGRAMPNVCLSLQPKGKTVAENWIFDCTDEQGRYELRDIPPGAYIIVVNYHGKISSDEPFPTAYYPGVFEKKRAGLLSIANGDKLADVDIHIPSQETRNVIQGLLLYSDGRPVADEFVEFKAEAVKEGYSGEVHTKTDAEGRFSLNVLRGLKGRIYGFMYTHLYYCPQLEKLIKEKGGNVSTIETTPIQLEVTADLQDVRLIFPFPYCAKAKRE
jgi:hypothetical protein